ncbi:MAG: hypothetical protein R3B40_05875 [Polyangiales bacterium]|nr:hypothetical protein [Myxococcales bacterium]MCB9657465.1 hypothetical protein [Sandaracinaceae bacterium]
MIEIRELASLEAHLAAGHELREVVLCGLDLSAHGASLRQAGLDGAVLLGCEMGSDDLAAAVDQGALVFPRLPRALPFEPWRSQLYRVEQLFDAFDPTDPCSYCDTLDARIYRHFRAHGGADEPGLLEALARRLHDHGISEALEAFLVDHPRVVAFMGGHGMARGTEAYDDVARLSAQLAARGFLIATGGGPGAMEAANLGGRLCRAPAALSDALGLLSSAPKYTDERWLARAFEVRARYAPLFADPAAVSLGVPTFFYGHEPPNAFASHHAKYFANCTREEGLVSLATHGIVFAPGSGGTVQEIFQDACQNHYGTVRGLVSPMALYGVDYWTNTLPAAPLLRALSDKGGWSDRVLVTDDPDEIVAFVERHGPRAVRRDDWSFCGAHCAS